MSVQQEVTRALAAPQDFLDVPADDPHRFIRTGGLARDSADNGKPAWVVCDGNYASARWPGDAYSLAHAFDVMLREYSTAQHGGAATST